jgi:hypothetical protein
MNLKKVFYAFLFLIILSCAKFDLVTFDNEKNQEKANISCKVKKAPIKVYSENDKLNMKFEHYISTTNQNLLDYFFQWSLLQLASRPDATTLNSRTLNYIKYKGQEFFLMTTPKDHLSSSFLVSLEEVRKFYKNRLGINSYANMLDKGVNRTIPVAKPLQDLIERNKVAYYKNKTLRKYTFKGNQIVRVDESINIPNFSQLIKKARTLDKNVFKTNHLFRTTKKYSCNFDKRLFSASPIIQRKTNEIKSNFYGIFLDKNNYTISLTSSMPSNIQFHKKYFSLESLPTSSFNAAFCVSNNQSEFILAKNLIHSEQLLNNVLNSLNGNEEPQEIINYKRHVNLLYPERSVIEIYGKKLNEPGSKTTYHVPTLGKIDIVKYNSNFELYKEPRTGILKCN